MADDLPWLATTSTLIRRTVPVDGWPTDYVFIPGREHRVSVAGHDALVAAGVGVVWEWAPRG